VVTDFIICILEKEKKKREKKRLQLLYLRGGGLPGFVFVFHISMISSEFLLMPALFHASSGAENEVPLYVMTGLLLLRMKYYVYGYY